jgi:hypothetical protein
MAERKRAVRTPRETPSPRGWRGGGSDFVVVSQQDGNIVHGFSDEDPAVEYSTVEDE